MGVMPSLRHDPPWGPAPGLPPTTERMDRRQGERWSVASDCPHNADCPLFERFELSSVLRIWQIYYCKKNYTDCIRYQMNCRGEAVPPTMLPNGEDMEGEGGR